LYLSLFLMFTSPTALSTLSLHDALPIYDRLVLRFARHDVPLIPHPGCALHTTCDTASGTRRSTGGFAKATVTTAATGKTARIAMPGPKPSNCAWSQASGSGPSAEAVMFTIVAEPCTRPRPRR